MQRLEADEGLDDASARARLYPFLKRTIDLTISVLLLILLSPLFLGVGMALLMSRSVNIIQRTPKMGLECRPFSELSFATQWRVFRNLPILINILKGDLSFVGPRAAYSTEMCSYCRSEPRARLRKTVRPGLICDWWVRRHISLDYVQEVALDVRYVQNMSLRKDIGIVLRAIPGVVTWLLWGNAPPVYRAEVRLLGVRIDNMSMNAAIDRIVAMMDSPQAGHVCFVNPHNINQTFRVPEYKRALDEADLVLADGFGTKLAGEILRQPIRQNLCGTDLFPRLCARLSGSEKKIYLLGSSPGIAERVADWVRQHYPGVVIKGCDHGYFSPMEEREVVRRIAQSGADILIVAMGVPKQELWIHNNLADLNVRVAMGWGGLFDYFSGRIPRAPLWVREIGMEWVYRLIQEPGRMWKRYLIGNFVFLFRVVRERFRATTFSSRCNGIGPRN